MRHFCEYDAHTQTASLASSLVANRPSPSGTADHEDFLQLSHRQGSRLMPVAVIDSMAVANPIPLLPPVIMSIFPSNLPIRLPPTRKSQIRAYEDQWADLRSANQLASVITERKPISKYA